MSLLTDQRAQAKLSDGLTPQNLAPSSHRGRMPGFKSPAAFFRRRWKATAALAVVLALAYGLWFSRRAPAEEAGAPVAGTARIERRDFVRSLRVHGTTAAVESFPITVPRMAGERGRGQLIITRLALSGSRVKAGDLLVEFDRQEQVRNALDRRAEFLDLEEQIKKKIAEQTALKAQDDTELTQSRNDLEKARLEMRRNEVLSRIDAEINKQTLEESAARLKQLEATYQLKRTAARADLRILEIRRDRARSAMLHAEGNSERMAIRSPIDGLVVINTVWKGGSMGEVLEGDEVRPGLPILQVVNPSSMEVRARVNQADVAFLRVGQSAEFRLDAFPDLVFRGKLERVSAMGAASNMNEKVRHFAAVFSVQGSDSHLLPDLAAAVDAELERLPDALVAPRDALVNEDGKTFLRVQTGDGWQKREVKVIGQNDLEVALESGVELDEVVLRSAAQAAGGQS
ncbi:MAG: efflux RND transporter periplasmic adaptor subunit [Candidatus Acidiferrales bacterium]